MIIYKQCVAEVSAVYRRTQIHMAKIKNSKDVFDWMVQIYNPDTIDYQESFFIAFLNRNNNITGFAAISKGSDTGTIASTKLIVQHALLAHACSVIISHNHPSGSKAPSNADIALTKNLKQALAFMDISLADHIIITSEGYYSFADEGIL